MREEYEVVGGVSVRRRWWDDNARVVRTYDNAGTELLAQQRPYDADELADATARVASAATDANKTSTELNLEADLAWLQLQIGKTNPVLNAEIANNPAQFWKPVLKALRRGIRVNLSDYSTGD
ncbi:MAG TPA: hypothetical protein VIS29_06410 [Streptomyces sp.]|jgi:hypothetical protein